MSDERKNRFAMVTDNDEPRMSSASRARNRTVLLTPETVGQVRAQMTDEVSDPMNDLLPPTWESEERDSVPGSGFVRPGTGGFERPEDVIVEEPRPSFNPRQQPGRASASFGFRAGAAYPTPGGPQKKAPSGVEHRPEVAPSYVKPVARPKSKIVGFLISFEAEEFGEVFEIRQGRFIFTSRPIEHGDFILVDDDSISPMHAVIRATADGKIQILDQLSEHGTAVLRANTETEEEVMGATVIVNHGDVVRFGRRHFTVCLIPPITMKAE